MLANVWKRLGDLAKKEWPGWLAWSVVVVCLAAAVFCLWFALHAR